MTYQSLGSKPFVSGMIAATIHPMLSAQLEVYCGRTKRLVLLMPYGEEFPTESPCDCCEMHELLYDMRMIVSVSSYGGVL